MDPKDVLSQFQLDKVLHEEPARWRVTLLGTLPASWATLSSSYHSGKYSDAMERLTTIIRVEKSALSSAAASALFDASPSSPLIKVKLGGATDIYAWLSGWCSIPEDIQAQGDLRINIICPATDVHIRKYSPQESILVSETPSLYQSIVLPYIEAFPPQRTQWVRDILEGRAEQEKILCSSPDFIILPDMKWDLHTISSLYLMAIVRQSRLRSLRDLRSGDIPLLQAIKTQAYLIVGEKWNIKPHGLRLYIHYQPSYYHFHVHIVNANFDVGLGMSVGQAHLLEDVISMLELDSTIFERMTLTYGLGDQHGLYEQMKAAQNHDKE